MLLLSGRGHGDMIQFALYAPMLEAKATQVTLQTNIRLKALMRMPEAVDTVISPDDEERQATS